MTDDAAQRDSAFRAIARAYDLLVNEDKRWANEREAIADWLEQAGAGRRRVLDLGTGTGFHARHCAAQLDAEVTASDPAAEILDVARSKPHGEQVRWVVGSAESPPPGEYDLILLLGNTLGLIVAPEAVFAAAARVAAPDALLVVQTLDYDALRRRGEQHLERTGPAVSITKRLRPLPPDRPVAAELTLQVFDPDGRELARQEERLIDHPISDLKRAGEAHGWFMIERRRSYRDPERGDDRILVFRLRREPPREAAALPESNRRHERP